MPKDGEPILRHKTHIKVYPNPGDINYVIYRCLRAEGLPVGLKRITDDCSTIRTDLPSTRVRVLRLFKMFPAYQRTALLEAALEGDPRGVARLGDPAVIENRGLIVLPGDEIVYDRAFQTAVLRERIQAGFPLIRAEEDVPRCTGPLAQARYPLTLLSAAESLRAVYEDLRKREASKDTLSTVARTLMTERARQGPHLE